MMQLERTYDSCLVQGIIAEEDSVFDESFLFEIKKELEFLKKEKINKKNLQEVFQKYSSILENLLVLVLKTKGIKILDSEKSQECANACICIKYLDLELNWEFLEGIRLKKINQAVIKQEEWIMLKINFDLHINSCFFYLNDFCLKS